MDFSVMNDGQLIEFASNLCGVSDGMRIYGNGENRFAPEYTAIESLWEQTKAEVHRRDLADAVGIA